MKTPKVVNIMDALKKSMQAKGQTKVRDTVRKRMGEGRAKGVGASSKACQADRHKAVGALDRKEGPVAGRGSGLCAIVVRALGGADASQTSASIVKFQDQHRPRLCVELRVSDPTMLEGVRGCVICPLPADQ